MNQSAPSQILNEDDGIDFADIFLRFKRGFVLILALTLLGVAAGIIISLATTNQQAAVSTLRVNFGFPGFERGTYPNGTKFQPDDIRAPDVVNEAIRRLGAQNMPPDLSSRIRGAIGISGFISPGIVKERDRLRAAGQTLPPYFPDEYEISLSLPRSYPLGVRQRELLLAEIVNVYLEKFRRSYVELPPEFGSAFAALENADFVEYELILTQELQSLSSYLEQRTDTDREVKSENKETLAQARSAKQFRSPTNNLSFQDLHKQTTLFAQVRLNDVLSQIYIYGLSKNRTDALTKMNYYMRTLDDQEQRLKEEESVVTNLLSKTQERAQNYVLAAKVQNPPSAQPLMDQGFIDSLLANDAYNFLVRRALDAGLAVKRVQSDKARLLDRRQRMESFTKGESKDQAAAVVSMQRSLAELEISYKALLSKVSVVLEDYARQEFADAVRITAQAQTTSMLKSIIFGTIIGGLAGCTLGSGLALLKPTAIPAKA
jgi:hypothetical protein